MNKPDKNFSKFLTRMIATVCLLPLLCAWVDPVNLTADNEVSVTITEDNISGTPEDTIVKSCTDNTALNSMQCHRWNLIWAPIGVGDPLALTQQSDWVPSLPNDANDKAWRLPTIKELTRLINFNIPVSHVKANTLLESPIIKNWFTQDGFLEGNETAINDGSKTAWLISSTYRDIDGVTDTPSGDVLANQAQVFAINIINGKIKTFEPGVENDNGIDPISYELKLCESLKNTGECNFSQSVENIVFALKVRTKTISELKE
ncbi:MAG: hypothetical protein JXR16_16700 [Bermanella sp.]